MELITIQIASSPSKYHTLSSTRRNHGYRRFKHQTSSPISIRPTENVNTAPNSKAKEIADLVNEHDDVHNAYDEAEDTGQINGHYKIVWYPDGEDYEEMPKTSKVITKEFLLEANQSTYIPINTLHRLENPTEENIAIIEVQCGDYFGEDDIERLEDIYGRLK